MADINLGMYEYNNYRINVSLNDIKNPYCVYLPIKENGIIINIVYINEFLIGLFLYNYYKTNIYKYKSNKDITCNLFLDWIFTLKNINYSNWKVIVLRLFKNNVLN
jgi:hypothetical protein